MTKGEAMPHPFNQKKQIYKCKAASVSYAPNDPEAAVAIGLFAWSNLFPAPS